MLTKRMECRNFSECKNIVGRAWWTKNPVCYDCAKKIASRLSRESYRRNKAKNKAK